MNDYLSGTEAANDREYVPASRSRRVLRWIKTRNFPQWVVFIAIGSAIFAVLFGGQP